MSFRLVHQEKAKEIKERLEDSGIHGISESSDVAQTIKELNDDTVTERFTAIDMKSRLASVEVSSIIAVDSLVALTFLPPEVSSITRSKKRLSVSLEGKGRGEIVGIAQGMRQNAEKSSLFDKIGGFFGGGA
jgi:hypothetical protein